jgi:WD40 repeat protein
MGEVWQAFDLKLRLDVALKSLRHDLFQGEEGQERLRSEVRSARDVISPHVCRIFDLVVVEGQELVSMEYIDGETLVGLLKARGPLGLREAQEIASQFLAGLEAIHRAGLVHRDLKPENVMITRAGRVVVMDFGVAKPAESAGTVSGTPAYMAPEQARGATVDARADVFSAGVVLAEMVSEAGVRDHQSRESVWSGVREEPARLPDSPWHPVLRRAVARVPEERYTSAQALARALEEVTLRVEGAEDITPYPGLAPFTEAEAEYFFGREAEVEAVWKKLRDLHLLAIIGPSGAGKSSFLQAGLMPAKPEGWRIVLCSPGTSPFVALAQALAPELSGDTEAIRQLVRIEDVEVALSMMARWRRRHAEVLVIVDQFEELFTLNPPEVQQRFAELLGRMAIEADVRVVLSMRDDFFLHCHKHVALAPIFSEPTPLEAPAGSALRRALVQPALKCGYRFEDEALVEKMLAEVAEERGALPLLAFAASRLWEKRGRENGLLRWEDYEAIGGVGGALAQHAEATLDRIGTQRVPVVREIFRNLVTAQGTRAARDMEELLSVFEDREAAREVLGELIDARLLTSFEVRAGEGEEASRHRVEIIHESLLSAWPRLVRWQTQDADSAQLRDQLRQAAQLWESRGRAEDLLWTGASYLEFRAWRQQYRGGLTSAEEAFAGAMKEQAERQRRRRRLVVTLVIVALLVGLGVTGSLWKRSEAQARRAEGAKLLALGQLEMEDDPTAALAYAIARLELADDPHVRRFALEALWKGPTEFQLSEHLTPDADFSPDDRWLATAEQFEGGIRIALRPGHDDTPTFLPTGNENRLLFVDSDRLLAWETDGETASIWSVSRGQRIRQLDFRALGKVSGCHVAGDRLIVLTRDDTQQGPVRLHALHLDGGAPLPLGQIEVSPVGDAPEASSTPAEVWRHQRQLALAAVDPSGTRIAYPEGRSLYVSRLDDLEQRTLVGRHDTPLWSTTFDAAGQRLASVDTTGEVRIWSARGGASDPLRIIRTGLEKLRRVEFDATGSKLVADWDQTQVAAVWDLNGPPDAKPVYLKRREGWVWGAAFQFGGPWVAAGIGLEGYVYPLARPFASVLEGHKGEMIGGIAFSPDGKWLASSSFVSSPSGYDGELLLWPLSAEVAEQHRVQMVPGHLVGLAFDPAGRFIVAGTHSSRAPRIFPLDGSAAWQLSGLGQECPLHVVAVGPHGRWVAAGAVDRRQPDCMGRVRVWDLEAGEIHVLDVGDGSVVGDIEFTADGRLLVGYEGADLRLWNVEEGKQEVVGEGVECSYFDLSHDGRTLVCTSLEDLRGVGLDRVFVYDLETGTRRDLASHGDVRGHDEIWDVAVDPTGRFVATGDATGAVRVIPVMGGEPHLLLGHEGRVGQVAFSPDGQWIASAGEDVTVRLWPIPEGPPLHTLPYEELLEKLRSLTNVRVVPDAESSTRYRVDFEPFPGFDKVPVW